MGDEVQVKDESRDGPWPSKPSQGNDDESLAWGLKAKSDKPSTGKPMTKDEGTVRRRLTSKPEWSGQTSPDDDDEVRRRRSPA